MNECEILCPLGGSIRLRHRNNVTLIIIEQNTNKIAALTTNPPGLGPAAHTARPHPITQPGQSYFAHYLWDSRLF
jgi:hypothetical protein